MLQNANFQVDEVTFPGLPVNQSGVHPNPEKITPIKHAPQPKNLKQIQAFLGAANYLSEFLPHLADMAEPLRILTQKRRTFFVGRLSGNILSSFERRNQRRLGVSYLRH